MAYETITCRMSRSDPSIRWGFTVRQQGADIIIAHIDVDSLADKAGLKTGDIVDQVANRRAASVGDVQREIDTSHMEMSMNLRRFMAHPPTLPWTLTEGSDNKLLLNQGFGKTIDNKNTTSMSAISKSAWENPSYKGTTGATTGAPFTSSTPSGYTKRYETTNSSYSQSQSGTGGNAISAAPIALPPPPLIPSGPNTFSYQHHESTKTESKSTSGPGANPADNYNVTSRSEWSDTSGNPPLGFDPKNAMSTRPLSMPPPPLSGPNTYSHYESTKSESKSATGPGTTPGDNYNVSSSTSYSTGNPPPNFNPNAPGFPSLSTAPFSTNTPAAFGGSGFGASSGGFGGGAPGGGGAGYGGGYPGGGVNTGSVAAKRAQFADNQGPAPYGRQTYIQTGGAGAPSPFQKAHSLSPGGRMLYQAPSSRTRKELSPNSSIHHLQYNSPMNLYSTESAAEQYSQQTGMPVGNVPAASAPYLSSATRQAIAEEEGGRFARGMSPSCSPCFKRISNAVGTPVN